MNEPEIDAVVSMRAGPEGQTFIEGSEVRDCQECGHGIQISPATQHAIATGTAPERFLCLQCAAESDEEDLTNL